MPKIINRSHCYSPIDFSSSTFLGGKIILTKEEWRKAFKYLTSKKVKKMFLPSYPWVNELFLEDIQKQRITKKSTQFEIRVPMTEKLVSFFHLNNYRRHNYLIEVLN